MGNGIVWEAPDFIRAARMAFKRSGVRFPSLHPGLFDSFTLLDHDSRRTPLENRPRETEWETEILGRFPLPTAGSTLQVTGLMAE